MEVEGEELPPYSPDFQDYVNKVKENGSERIEYNIASVVRGFDTGDIDGRTADIIVYLMHCYQLWLISAQLIIICYTFVEV